MSIKPPISSYLTIVVAYYPLLSTIINPIKLYKTSICWLSYPGINHYNYNPLKSHDIIAPNQLHMLQLTRAANTRPPLQCERHTGCLPASASQSQRHPTG